MIAGCRHCGRLGKQARCRGTTLRGHRGLCWCCYWTPAIRAAYPSLSKYGRRGISEFERRVCREPFPTTAVPGTPEKLEVLAARAEAGEELFHELDAAFNSEELA